MRPRLDKETVEVDEAPARTLPGTADDAIIVKSAFTFTFTVAL